MHHYHAGYIIDIIANKIDSVFIDGDDKKILKIKGLLDHLTSFDVQFPEEIDLDHEYLNPFLATLNNIITRGLPTKAPVLVEEQISKALGITQRNHENQFEIEYVENNYPISYELIFDLLHLVEPGLKITQSEYLGELDSKAEWDFIDVGLNGYPYAKQILQPQRHFSTLNYKIDGDRTADFCFQSPYHKWNAQNQVYESVSRIFEIDGPHHDLQEYRMYDKYRDEITAKEGFETLRIPSVNVRNDNTNLNNLFNRSIYQIYQKIYQKNISEYINEYIPIFTPLAVARIQKTLIEYFLAHHEILNKNNIHVAIIERDVPCGALAVKSLKKYFENLNELLAEDSQVQIPEFSVTVFPDSRFDQEKVASLHIDATVSRDEQDFVKNAGQYDLIIDHSILRRSGIYQENDFIHDHKIYIRSSHYSDHKYNKERKVYCATPLNYKSLVFKQEDGNYAPVKQTENSIKFFIRNIFRKTEFRDGQLPILSRSLRQLPVIGLLPTGGGKSITFQLAVLMQPGLSIIVDPIKSLMEDQVRVLKNNWIDCCEYINSTLPAQKKRERLIDFRYGEKQMLFVSPERFVMEEFREIVRNISSFFGLAITYCVIDEVHCVSEWGHDFRSTYLFLGRNAQRYCATKNANKVSLMGLTATASFDVMADVERELEIGQEDTANAIIQFENTIRPEMFFRIVNDNRDEKIKILNEDINKAGKNLQFWNNFELLKRSFNDHLEEFNEEEKKPKGGYAISNENNIVDLSKIPSGKFPAIMFCATKSIEHEAPNSVMDIYNRLNSQTKGFFYGSDENDIHAKEIRQSFQLFLSGRLNHMVCTKAFGMGIDKKDVRISYHINHPGSLESFVQEAGRVGRDKKISEAVVLYNDNAVYKIDQNLFKKKNYDKHRFLRNKWYRKNLRWELIIPNQSNKREDIESLIDDFSFTINFPPPENVIPDIKKFLKSNISGIQKDRKIHEFFYNKGFKGIEAEEYQMDDLFRNQEFLMINNEKQFIPDQTTLEQEFDQAKEGIFNYILTSKKDIIHEVCELLELNEKDNNILKQIQKILNYSKNHFDFLMQLEERGYIDLPLPENIERKIRFRYLRDRESNNTGKIIYRMSCMGLLDDYTIDYKKQHLITCYLVKNNSIEYYLEKIKNYFLKYLSETSCNEKLYELNERLEKKDGLTEKILECLYYLTEFSYEQIADKRRRATNGIEQMLVRSLEYKDQYACNHFIKREIYYYFNGKYVRDQYRIEGKNFSLLLDSDYGRKSSWAIVEKYTVEALRKEPETPQNNYRHLIGSCRKITRGMASGELEKEWSLSLILAFALYAVNVPSFISEANENLKKGFTRFYQSEACNENYQEFESKFTHFFNILQHQLEKNNSIFLNELRLIKHTIMIDIYNQYTRTLIDNHKAFTTKQ